MGSRIDGEMLHWSMWPGPPTDSSINSKPGRRCCIAGAKLGAAMPEAPSRTRTQSPPELASHSCFARNKPGSKPAAPVPASPPSYLTSKPIGFCRESDGDRRSSWAWEAHRGACEQSFRSETQTPCHGCDRHTRGTR